VRDLDWIERHIDRAEHIAAVDVTSSYAVFGVMGPAARRLLQPLTRADLSDQAFPFATSRLIDVGYSTVRATRITYVGELGWELYVPVEFAVGVYEELREAGREHGLAEAGYNTINSLRLEKGYRAFGADIGPDENPVEAGLLFTCKLASDIDFVGREAVQKVKAAGPRRRLVSLVLDDPETMLWGSELVLRDGVAVGQVRSAAWGETVGASVALAMVWRPDGEPVRPDHLRSGRYAVDVGGEVRPATVHLRSPYDPDNVRIGR
jgi:4-methylaminobutanoate oxidase (formaldehyde-forming)